MLRRIELGSLGSSRTWPSRAGSPSTNAEPGSPVDTASRPRIAPPTSSRPRDAWSACMRPIPRRLPLRARPGPGYDLRRSRARALRGSIPGEAPRDAPDAVRLPARPAGRRASGRERAGRRAGAPPARPGRPGAGLRRDGARWLETVSRWVLAALVGRPRTHLRRAADEVPLLDGVPPRTAPAPSGAARFRSGRACSPRSRPRAPSCAARMRAPLDDVAATAGRRWRRGSAAPSRHAHPAGGDGRPWWRRGCAPSGPAPT